jgi:membrane associated rhomboid family serine protease
LICAGGSDVLPSDTQGGYQDKNFLVVCFGEMLIDFVPTVAGVSLAEAPAFKKAPGGAPANVAVGISRLGGSSAFIGKVHTCVLLHASFQDKTFNALFIFIFDNALLNCFYSNNVSVT